LELLGQIIASLHFKTENGPRLPYAHCDFDQCLAHFSKVASFYQLCRIFFKYGTFFQVWHVFASVAHFSKCGAFYQVWRIFPSLAQFSKSEAFFKVWCILRNFKPRQLGVTLEFPGLENILEGLGNRAEVGENYHARKAVSATLSVLK